MDLPNPAAQWTSYSNYIFDFQRGLVTHSKLLSREQFRRYVPEGQILKRPDLNPRQARDYFLTYYIGERFLYFLKAVHGFQLQKLAFQSSPTYFKNHFDKFEQNHYNLMYPVVQRQSAGYVRTSKNRDAIVEYMRNIQSQCQDFGISLTGNPKDEVANDRIYNKMRQIAFKEKSTAVKKQATQEPEDE